MVETALILTVILLPLTMGIIQFGMIFNASNTMTQIAREGGRYAAVHGQKDYFDGSDAQPASGQPASLRFYLKTVAGNTGIPWDSIKNSLVITPSTRAARVSGQPVSISITYPMKNKVFLGRFPMLGSLINKLDDDYVAKSTFVTE